MIQNGQQWKRSNTASLFKIGNEIVCGSIIIEEHSCYNYKQNFIVILFSELTSKDILGTSLVNTAMNIWIP
jgi:hypothetical protein